MLIPSKPKTFKPSNKKPRAAAAAKLILLISLFGLLLSACGEAPTPQPPSGATSSATIGQRGSSVMLTGNDFGNEAGTITVGGASATVTSWSDSSVVFTIPADAPSAFQTITLTTPGGSSSIEEFFVGVEFLADDLAALAGLGLPKGTAVLLGEKNYTVAVGALVELDNLSLHGQGIASTTITTGDPASILHIVASPGFDVSLNDLTLDIHMLAVSERKVPSTFVPFAMSASGTELEENSHLIESARATALELRNGAEGVGTQAARYGSFTLNNAVMNVAPLGFGLLVADLGTGELAFPGDVALRNTDINGAEALNTVLAVGDVEISDSSVNGEVLLIVSLAGALNVVDSQFRINEESAATVGPAMIAGARSLDITDSSIIATDSDLLVGSTLFFWEIPLSADLIRITGSSFEVRDSDPTDANDEGELMFEFVANAVEFNNNTVKVDYGLYVGSYSYAFSMTENEFTIGHLDVPEVELAVESWGLNSVNAVNNNTVTFLSEGNVLLHGVGEIEFNDNDVSGHSNSGTALDVFKASEDLPLLLTATRNTFTGFENAVSVTQECCDPPTGALTGEVTGNVFEFPITAAPQAAYFGPNLEGNLDLSNNRWGTNTIVATVESFITNDSDPDLEVTVGPLMP